MDVLSALTSIFAGGVTGLAGTVIQNVYQYKSKQLDLEATKQKAQIELEQRKLDLEIAKQEAASKIEVANVEAESIVAQADDKALEASYALEPQQYAEKSLLTHAQNWILVLLDALRAIIRPGLTVYLCAITTLIYVQTRSLIAGNPGDSFVLLGKLVDTILFLTTTVVLWYFGSRNKGK